MLERLNYSFDLDEEIRPGSGLWTREQLERMDAAYVVAVERAFDLGLESPSAARAAVKVNGKQRLSEEGAIELAWDRLVSKRGQISASEVLAFVRKLYPRIDSECVRVGLAWRLQQRGALW